jgi:hypothetical protein
MSDLLNNFTDDEVEKYNAAARIKQAGLDVKTLKNKKSVYNPETKTHDILTQMSGGGYVKIGEESLDLEATRPGSILLNGMEYGRETPEYQRYYPDPEPQPNVMTVSPSIGQIEEAETAPLVSEQSRIESAKDYAEFLNTRGGATAQDLLAAGYTPEIVNTVMGGTTQDNMPNEVIRTEPLSTEEVEDIIRSGGSVIGEYDPTLRETGRRELSEYLLGLAEQSFAEDLRNELLERGSIETDGRLIQPLSTEQIDNYIQRQLESARPRLKNESSVLSDMFFGSPSSLGIGVGDFVTAGIMDIQEGARLFSQGRNSGSVADRAFGALLVIAGLAEATGVGMLVGKAIKKSIPTLRAGLADVGERLNQPGEMPTVGSNLGNLGNVGDVAKVEAPTENKPGIIAFHGSGADFNEFKLEKIGTGEGNQAYGYGLYFTDVEDIADFYKDAMHQERNFLHLQGKPLNTVYTAANEEKFSDYVIKNFNPDEHDDVYRVIDNLGQGLSSLDDADAMAESSLNKAQMSLYEKIRNDLTLPDLPKGKMYKVNLDVNINDLVDYDKSLNEQSSKIKKALKPFYEKYSVANSADFGTLLESVRSMRSIPEDEFSEQLVAQGIQGVKYKAAGSRGADRDVADVKMNYVIFDDKLIDIIKKYGIVPPVAVTAMAAKKDEKET